MFVIAYGVGHGTLSLPIPEGCPDFLRGLLDGTFVCMYVWEGVDGTSDESVCVCVCVCLCVCVSVCVCVCIYIVVWLGVRIITCSCGGEVACANTSTCIDAYGDIKSLEYM